MGLSSRNGRTGRGSGAGVVRRLVSGLLVAVLATVTVGGVEPATAQEDSSDSAEDAGGGRGSLGDARDGWRGASESGDRVVPEPEVFSEDGVPRVDAGPPLGDPPASERAREVTSQRSERARVFELEDGRLQQEVAASPLHYLDGDGEWREIDTQVSGTDREGFVFGNETNSFSSFFGTSADELVRIERDGASVSLGLEPAGGSGADMDGATEAEAESAPDTDPGAEGSDGSEAAETGSDGSDSADGDAADAESDEVESDGAESEADGDAAGEAAADGSEGDESPDGEATPDAETDEGADTSAEEAPDAEVDGEAGSAAEEYLDAAAEADADAAESDADVGDADAGAASGSGPAAASESDQEPAQLPAPTVDGNRVTYADALGEGVDLVYEVTEDSLKEEIVVTSPPEDGGDLVLDFVLTLGGDLEAVEQDDGSVTFHRGETDGEPLLTMPAPFMVDQTPEPESPYGQVGSTAVEQSLSEVPGEDAVGLTVTADGEWLADSAREYPVVIDPTVRIQPTPTDAEDAMVLSEFPGENYSATWRRSVGTTSSGVARSLLRFPLPQSLEGVSLDSASLRVWYDQSHTSTADDVTIEARRADSAWDASTVTWDTAPEAAELGHNTAEVDDGAPWQTSATGTWAEASSGDAVGGSYLTNTGGGSAETYRWHPGVTEAGRYRVDVYVVEGPDRASDAEYTVDFDGGSETYTVDQSATSEGGRWETLGYHDFAAGFDGTVTLAGSDDAVVAADAVRLVHPAREVRPAGDHAGDWHEFSVRSIVQDWVDGTEANHGFVLQAEDEATLGAGGPRYEGSVFGYGGETDTRPTLVLTYGRPSVELDPPSVIHATGAELGWSAYEDPCGFCSDDDIVEYQVHRSVHQTFTPSAETLVAPVDPETTSYRDTTAEPTPADDPDPFGNAYYYMVAVRTADGQVTPGPTELVRLPKAGHVTRLYQPGDALADTTLSSAQPDTNHSAPWGEPWLYAGNNSATYGETRALLDFGELSGLPEGAEVVDAELKLWNEEVVGDSDAVWQLHGLTTGFDPDAATWNTTDGSTPWASPGGDFVAEPSGTNTGFQNDPQRRNWDATSIVEGWVADPSSNHGMLLRVGDTGHASRALFSSGDGREPRLTPRLAVTYIEATPEATYHVPDTPEVMAAGLRTTTDVTVTNTTGESLAASDWVLSYRWTHPDGSAADAVQTQTALPEDLAAGETVTVAAEVAAPDIGELDGNDRAGMVLAWDLYDTTTDTWLSGAGASGVSASARNTVGALTQSLAVEDSTSDQVGLESFYAYDGTNTGAGSVLMNNTHAGNTVWSYDAFANPSRGLSTFARMTYNSKDTSDTVAGYGWSVQTSAVMRLGSPLDVHPMPHGNSVFLTDGDGTTHEFAFDDTTGEYTSPAGLNMFLERLDDDCMTRHRDENPQAWRMTSPDRTQFYFDCQGYVSSVEDNNGNTLTFTYEQHRSNNQPTKSLRYITDSTGRRTLEVEYYERGDDYDYIDDETWTRESGTNLSNPHIIGNVRSITDISGRTVTFAYTDHGLLGELVDGAGSGQPKVFRFQYVMTQGNRNVKLVAVTDPRGNTTAVDYYEPSEGDDPAFHWSTQTVTDRTGGTLDFAYADADGQTGQAVNTTVTDAETNSTEYATDGRGRPTSSTNAAGQATGLVWNEDNKVVELTEANGAVTTWSYDELTGYPLEIRDPEANEQGYPGTTLTYQRGLGGHIADVASVTSPEGRTSTFTYSTEGDLETVTDPLGNHTSEEGDYTTSYTYDEWGQLLTATDANGNTTTNSGFGPNGYPEQITDPLGETTSFTYDERGQVTEVTDPLGAVTTQSYDTFGRPLENTVPMDQDAGELITTPAPTYDANDNITEAFAPNGAVSEAVYDPSDRVTDMLSPVDEAGDPERRSTFTYDAAGNLLTETEPNGNAGVGPGDFTTSYVYDEIYQLTDVTNADGDSISYTYDDVGNLVTVTDPRRNADPDNTAPNATFWYDRNHRVRAEIDTENNAVVTDYDRDGLVVAVSDQEGNKTETESDARGAPVEVRSPSTEEGLVTTYDTVRFEYDQVGNRTRTLTPRAVEAGSDEAFIAETVYDELNRPVEEIAPYDPADARYNTPVSTLYDYDPAGRLASVSLPPSDAQTVRNETNYEYFDNGWVRSSTDPWDIQTSYDYNPLGQQTATTVTSAGGSSSRTMASSYYPSGLLASRSDDGIPAGLDVVLVDNSDFNNTNTEGGWLRGDGVPDSYGYDAHATGSGSGNDTFTWDLHVPSDGDYEVFTRNGTADGLATDAPFEISHANGTDTVRVDQTANGGEWESLGTFSFDEGDSQAITVSDDANGIVVADAIKLVRDNSNDPGVDPERTVSYDYDPNGNVSNISDTSTDAEIDAYEIDYTGLNQAAQVDELAAGSVQSSTSFTYDPNGAPETVTHDDTFAEYTYNARNLVEQVTNADAAGDTDPNVTSYTYTPRGQVAQQVKPNGNTVDTTYDLAGRPASVVETQPDDTLVAEHAVEYTANGHRASDEATVQDGDDASSYLDTVTTYSYDPRDRIAEVDRTGDGAGVESYVHDDNNNVINQTIDGISTSFNYDRDRLLTASTSQASIPATYNYDPFGRLDTVTSGGEVIERRVYDGFDQVVEQRQMNGTGGTETTQFDYDPLGRTASRTDAAGTAEEETTEFDYLGTSSEVLSEEVAGDLTRSYQYSPWGQRLAQTVHNDDGTEEDGFYGYNLHSDVEQLTGEDGDTTATYGYTAYGNNNDALFTGLDAPTAGNPTDTEPYNVYRYNAKRWDAGSGDYDMGFRNYDPGLNRFISRDMYNGALADLNLATSPHTGNRYAFGAGNPVTNIEIDGHMNCVGGKELCSSGKYVSTSSDSGFPLPDTEMDLSTDRAGILDYESEILEVADYFDLDPALLALTIHHEGGNTAELGSMWRATEHAAGDRMNTVGIGQVDPDTAVQILDERWGIDMDSEQVREYLIWHDYVSIVLAGAALDDRRSMIRPSHRTRENIFVAYALSEESVEILDGVGWDYEAVNLPAAERRANEHYTAANEYVQGLQYGPLGLFGGGWQTQYDPPGSGGDVQGPGLLM